MCENWEDEECDYKIWDEISKNISKKEKVLTLLEDLVIRDVDYMMEYIYKKVGEKILDFAPLLAQKCDEYEVIDIANFIEKNFSLEQLSKFLETQKLLPETVERMKRRLGFKRREWKKTTTEEKIAIFKKVKECPEDYRKLLQDYNGSVTELLDFLSKQTISRTYFFYPIKIDVNFLVEIAQFTCKSEFDIFQVALWFRYTFPSEFDHFLKPFKISPSLQSALDN